MRFEIRDKNINSEEILSRIEKHISKKMQDAAYREDPFLATLRRKSAAGLNVASDELNKHVAMLYQNCDPLDFVEITSHRPKLGKYIVLVKAKVRDWVYPITKIIFAKQREFDVQACMLLGDVVKNMKNLQRRYEALEAAHYSIVKELTAKTAVKKGADAAKIGDVIQKVNSGFSYRKLNERFAGSVEVEKKLYEPYLTYFKDCNNVLDLGCGRGPFMMLLRENGIGCKGVDIDEDMVAEGKKEGLDMEHCDAIPYLQTLENDSLDGVFMGHLIEHIPVADLASILRHCHMKLKCGSYLVFETPNTESVFVLSNSYFKDPTHQLPRHSEFYRFLVEDIGFRDAEVQYSYDVPMQEKLCLLPQNEADMPEHNKEFVRVHNNNVTFLRKFLFGKVNLTIVARK